MEAMEPQEALQRCIILCGSKRTLAKRLKVVPSAINYWYYHHVPAKHVAQLVEISGHRLTEADFRPDINWTFIKRKGT